MARPLDLGPIQDRAFFLAGGYKYAMAGEGVCFLHSPPGYGPRPVDTGWYAGFGQLESGVTPRVEYAADGTRFAGATYDPSGVYRMNAVLRWLEDSGVGPADIQRHVVGLQSAFLSAGALPGELIPPEGTTRGNFLTFRNEAAEQLYHRLHEMKVITDHRRDRLRIGFGVYHDLGDVERLVTAIRSLGPGVPSH
jgi:selenocysteine lyase/cysteine desulfurase